MEENDNILKLIDEAVYKMSEAIYKDFNTIDKQIEVLSSEINWRRLDAANEVTKVREEVAKLLERCTIIDKKAIDITTLGDEEPKEVMRYTVLVAPEEPEEDEDDDDDYEDEDY